MLRRKAILAMSLLAALGCANKANMPKVVTPERPIPAKGIRLAVLPVESDGFPEVAEWVSNLLADVRVSGVDEYFKTRVALEVVQLSIECVDANAKCYTQVGKSLQANRLLMAVITGGSGRRKDRSVKVRIMLFDVDKGAEITSAEKQFKNKDEALADAEELVNQALGERKQASATPPGKNP
jgi:hypothetical protein